MAKLYIIQIDDWTRWYDLNIPDEAWITLVQNSDLETLIEIVDPVWQMALELWPPEFVHGICID